MAVVGHDLYFECEPCRVAWKSHRPHGQVWFADSCPVCSKTRAYRWGEPVEVETDQERYVREATF